MATQLKILAFGGVASVTAWCASVKYERERAMPQGRRRQFTPGSPLDITSEKLKTGDVVLFSRDCGLYYPCGAIHCEATKATTRQPFDHAAIIVLRHGFPYVAEWTPTGIKIRPFEERVMCSLAFQIVVLPLSKRLTKTSEENVRNYVAAAAEEQTSMQCYKEMMTDLAMQITGRNVSPSVQFVKNALSEGGFSEGGFSTDSPSACMSIKKWSDGYGGNITGNLEGETHPFTTPPLWFRNQK
eukprot:gb/GECG01000442.1/.p1 GENE.gb/GECG01000442.1/~~gb/GECG01000442.1/.p1  ORF type:complete len:242 (+),score=18.94 gb/GECG01000442.1/:1-726(+)